MYAVMGHPSQTSLGRADSSCKWENLHSASRCLLSKADKLHSFVVIDLHTVCMCIME